MTTATLGFAIDSSPASSAESALDRLVTAAGRTETAVDRMGSSASRAVTRVAGAGVQISQALGVAAANAESLSKRIESALNVRSSFGDRSKDIAAYGQELDRLRSKFNPVFTVLNNYKTVLGEIRQAQRLGAISADEMASAIGRERQAALSSIAALKGRQQAGVGGSGSFGNQSNPANVGYQLFDILQTAPYMSSPMVGLQQGPQLAQAVGGQSIKGALATLGAGLASIATPASLAAIGFTTAAAAAISLGSGMLSAVGSTSRFEDVLAKHEDTLKRIKGLYDAASESGAQFGQRAQTAIGFFANQDRTNLEKTLRENMRSFLGQAGASVNASQFDFEGFGASSIGSEDSTARFGKFTGAVKALVDQIHSGNPEVLEFNKNIQEIANSDPSDKKLQKIAQTLLGFTKEATEAADALQQLNNRQRELTIERSRMDAALSQQSYQRSNNESRFYRSRSYEAELSGIGARSPRAIADAERRRLQAEPVDPAREDTATREERINQQVELSYRRANQAIIDGQRDRQRNLEKMLLDQQVEIDLIGKTGGAAAALRREYELTSALRAEAARTGTEVDQKELSLIHEKTQALAALCDAYDQTGFSSGFDLENKE
ncbi:hypothetical protein DSM25558_0188 [Agrobacterium sp. DSM 25558]|uniref:hypothetical protein n=1 Tax=Agrobacterium sp. DSM 25558 TaxID=1907665 RepID=UPI00097260C3|nr:hypothetical protein [Agrobacterium sp. DSM 25558]SCX00858.1 hypothetical protein DSM25558_0188 [Agrobacterium sp. DSM 25558]